MNSINNNIRYLILAHCRTKVARYCLYNIIKSQAIPKRKTTIYFVYVCVGVYIMYLVMYICTYIHMYLFTNVCLYGIFQHSTSVVAERLISYDIRQKVNNIRCIQIFQLIQKHINIVIRFALYTSASKWYKHSLFLSV